MSLTWPHLTDWIQDSILERKRRLRNARKTHILRSVPRESMSRRLWARFRDFMDAGQTWFVISIVGEHWMIFLFSKRIIKILAFYSMTGICIGANAAVISIITQWLSDIKMGFCFDAWWLNQQFCCWEIEGEEVDGCDSWHSWSHVTLARWIIFVTFAVRFLLPHKLTGIFFCKWTKLF